MRHALLFLLIACGDKSGTPDRPRPQPADRESGLVAFEKVRSVLQHPRCQNCHPASDVPLQGDEGRLHNQNVQRGPEGKGMVGMECTTCHTTANPPDAYGEHVPPGAASGWRMPPPNEKMVFVGVPPGALCQQLRDPARNGRRDLAGLRHHLDDSLVAWGWSPGRGRKPIPMSRADFLGAFETWSAAGAPCPN